MNKISGRIVRAPGLALRAAKVSGIVAGYALLFGVLETSRRLRLGSNGRRERSSSLEDGERWVRVLTRLGPSYIKFGQLMSTRRDMLPPEVTGPLARLTDSAPPPSSRRIQRAVRAAYAGTPWPFREFTWEPVACGSIATVHRAVTREGHQVAVKVRRQASRP